MATVCEVGIRPKRTIGRRQFAIAAWGVVINTASVVALTHGGHITTSIDEPTYTSVMHDDFCVAIYLTGRPAIDEVCGGFWLPLIGAW